MIDNKNGADLRSPKTRKFSLDYLNELIQEKYPDGIDCHGAPAPTPEEVQTALDDGFVFVEQIEKYKDGPVEVLLALDEELGETLLNHHPGDAAHMAFDLIRNPVKTTPWFGVPFAEA